MSETESPEAPSPNTGPVAVCPSAFSRRCGDYTQPKKPNPLTMCRCRLTTERVLHGDPEQGASYPDI